MICEHVQNQREQDYKFVNLPFVYLMINLLHSWWKAEELVVEGGVHSGMIQRV